MPPSILLDLRECRLEPARGAVGPVRRHRFHYVGDGQDLRLGKDGVPLRPPG